MSAVALQPFPALDAATEAALRASIERFGVLVPVVKDQSGRILDGNHRARLADDLGVEYPETVQEVADEAEAREIARTLNADRRQLTPGQRQEVVAVLAEERHSTRAIAGALGVSQRTVVKDMAQVSTGTHLPEEVSGRDGKTYPRNGSGKGNRDRNKPYRIEKERHRQLAEAQKRRIVDGLSTISGVCRGLEAIDCRMAAACMDADEIATWATRSGELARALRAFKSSLTEVKDDAA